MEGTESVLEAIYEGEEDAAVEEETLDDDVEMLDAETLGGKSGSPAREDDRSVGDGGGGLVPPEDGSRGRNQRRRANKKKNKQKRRKGDSAVNITDINRFVIDTCRRLKEKKSYLVWNAVGCLGVATFSDLVKEVDAIQGCGGQKTVDRRRFRTGGGILWNILKTREPKAYKEIMAKGREFEKQLKQPRTEPMSNTKKEVDPQSTNAPVGVGRGEVMDSSEQRLAPSDSSTGRRPVLDRIRVPVAYDDLFEEGEICEYSEKLV